MWYITVLPTQSASTDYHRCIVFSPPSHLPGVWFAVLLCLSPFRDSGPGNIAGTPPSSSLRCMPSFLSRETRGVKQLPRRLASNCVYRRFCFYQVRFLGAFCGQFLHEIFSCINVTSDLERGRVGECTYPRRPYPAPRSTHSSAEKHDWPACQATLARNLVLYPVFLYVRPYLICTASFSQLCQVVKQPHTTRIPVFLFFLLLKFV